MTVEEQEEKFMRDVFPPLIRPEPAEPPPGPDQPGRPAAGFDEYLAKQSQTGRQAAAQAPQRDRGLEQ